MAETASCLSAESQQPFMNHTQSRLWAAAVSASVYVQCRKEHKYQCQHHAFKSKDLNTSQGTKKRSLQWNCTAVLKGDLYALLMVIYKRRKVLLSVPLWKWFHTEVSPAPSFVSSFFPPYCFYLERQMAVVPVWWHYSRLTASWFNLLGAASSHPSACQLCSTSTSLSNPAKFADLLVSKAEILRTLLLSLKLLLREWSCQQRGTEGITDCISGDLLNYLII